MAHCVFGFCFFDLAFREAHSDNGKDGLLSCLDVADNRVAKSLVEPVLDSGELSRKEIYRHKTPPFWVNLKCIERTKKKPGWIPGFIQLSSLDARFRTESWFGFQCRYWLLSRLTGHHSHDWCERNFFAVRTWICSLPGRCESLISFCIFSSALVFVASIIILLKLPLSRVSTFF